MLSYEAWWVYQGDKKLSEFVQEELTRRVNKRRDLELLVSGRVEFKNQQVKLDTCVDTWTRRRFEEMCPCIYMYVVIVYR